MREDLKQGDVVCWGIPDEGERGWGEIEWLVDNLAKIRIYDPALRISRARYVDIARLNPAPADHVITDEMRSWPAARRLPVFMGSPSDS